MITTGCTWPYGGTSHACAQDADFIVHRAEMASVAYMAAPMCTYHARLSRDFLIASYGADNVRFTGLPEAAAV